jgi:hypothetical protein
MQYGVQTTVFCMYSHYNHETTHGRKRNKCMIRRVALSVRMSFMKAENSAFVSLLYTTFQELFTVYYNDLLIFPYVKQFIECM